METLHKFWGWGKQTFSKQSKTQTSCDMAVYVIDTSVSFCGGKGITVQCHPTVQCCPT